MCEVFGHGLKGECVEQGFSRMSIERKAVRESNVTLVHEGHGGTPVPQIITFYGKCNSL